MKMASSLDIAYNKVKPFRFHACMAWLIEYEDGTRELMLLTPDSGEEDPGLFALRVARNYAGGRNFTIANVTVGQVEAKVINLYFDDARKIDQDGMVQV